MLEWVQTPLLFCGGWDVWDEGAVTHPDLQPPLCQSILNTGIAGVSRQPQLQLNGCDFLFSWQG